MGASLGGAIAINLATDVCPELVDKVVLLDGQVWCCCMCGCLLYIYICLGWNHPYNFVCGGTLKLLFFVYV